MRTLSLLGSTGSIGRSALEVVAAHPGELSVMSLAAHSNWRLLADQIRSFRPRLAVLFDETTVPDLKAEIRGCDVAVRTGMDGLLEAAGGDGADTLLTGLVGAVGLKPVLAGIAAGKRICLANKETLVVAGTLVMEAARTRGVEVLPVDSEHSAIFQCLGTTPAERIHRLILTASGGPFRSWPVERLGDVSPQQALKHPNWAMGGKITIDSATLMNKGLEVIEARWLFGLPYEQIEVVVHPQSIVHSLVEFRDGSVLAQLGPPDMRFAIQYALSFPHRWDPPAPRLNLLDLPGLTFEPPRPSAFPCLNLAFIAGKRGGNLPCILNAANEVAVSAFLAQSLDFQGIPRLIAMAMERVPFRPAPTLDELLADDAATRDWCREALPACLRGKVIPPVLREEN